MGTLLVAFVTNHRKAGFFVFRRPTEGWEYIMNLVAALLRDRVPRPGRMVARQRDRLHGRTTGGGSSIAFVIGVGGAAVTLVTFWRPPAPVKDRGRRR